MTRARAVRAYQDAAATLPAPRLGPLDVLTLLAYGAGVVAMLRMFHGWGAG